MLKRKRNSGECAGEKICFGEVFEAGGAEEVILNPEDAIHKRIDTILNEHTTQLNPTPSPPSAQN